MFVHSVFVNARLVANGSCRWASDFFKLLAQISELHFSRKAGEKN